MHYVASAFRRLYNNIGINVPPVSETNVPPVNIGRLHPKSIKKDK